MYLFRSGLCLPKNYPVLSGVGLAIGYGVTQRIIHYEPPLTENSKSIFTTKRNFPGKTLQDLQKLTLNLENNVEARSKNNQNESIITRSITERKNKGIKSIMDKSKIPHDEIKKVEILLNAISSDPNKLDTPYPRTNLIDSNSNLFPKIFESLFNSLPNS